MERSNSTIGASEFLSNQVIGEGSYGGALFISRANSTISDSSFVNNHIIGDGGALFIARANSTIIDSSFVNNTVNVTSGRGGALFMIYTTSVITDSLYTDNRADGTSSEGGALYIWESKSLISESVLANNRASKEGSALALFNNRHLAIDNSTFYNNVANGDGGALYFNSDSRVDCQLVKITNSTFIDNDTTGNVRLLSIRNNTIDPVIRENCVCHCSNRDCGSYNCTTNCTTLVATIHRVATCNVTVESDITSPETEIETSTIAATVERDITSPETEIETNTIAATSNSATVERDITSPEIETETTSNINESEGHNFLITIVASSVSGVILLTLLLSTAVVTAALVYKRIQRNPTPG